MLIDCRNIPLTIPAEEEITLKYMASIRRHQILTKGETYALIKDAQQNKDSAARKRAIDKLIRCNQRFVVSVARQICSEPSHIMDLVSEGNIGLLKAIEKFDTKTGNTFASYAVWWIRREMAIYMSDSMDAVRRPSKSKIQTAIKKARRELAEHLGREPHVDELKHYLQTEYKFREIDPSDLQGGMMVHIEGSASGERSKDDNTTGPDIVLSCEDEDHLQRSDVSMVSQAALDILSDRERTIVVMAFGLNGCTPTPFEIIGEKFSVSKERIRQIYCSTLAKMRNHLTLHKIKIGEAI